MGLDFNVIAPLSCVAASPSNSDQDSFGASLALGSDLELFLSPTAELSPTVVPDC